MAATETDQWDLATLEVTHRCDKSIDIQQTQPISVHNEGNVKS
jgi:hypothetical protein